MTDIYTDPTPEKEQNGVPESGEKATVEDTAEEQAPGELQAAEETEQFVREQAPPSPVVTPQPQYRSPYGVPPQQPMPQRQAVPPQYRPPQYRPPYGMPPQQQAPMYASNGTPYKRPQKPKKKHGATVAIVLLSVVCCFSLLFSCISGGLLLNDWLPQMLYGWQSPSINDGDNPQNNRPDGNASENNKPDDDREVNENSPTLEIADGDASNDGGLSTAEIVSRNLDATVVLTMYTEANSFFYGYASDDSGLTEAGGASGIIMTDDGYIITNSHCVYDEEMGQKYARIDVSLYDGRVFEDAKVIGYDPTTDLAVIKIDAKNLTAAEFGDSSALALGDRVVTLGNSGGLQWSVSQGVLSGQARDVYEDTGYGIKCLQVDAVINPGSSGGPLFNIYGQVVGVNSAKIAMTGYEGLGFSIPINEAKPIIDDLIKYGYVTGRVSLGIMGRTITSIGYEGFMIDSIDVDSPLNGTKAQAGDIITHVDDVRVKDYAELRAELTKHEVGETVTLKLLRLNRQTRKPEEIIVTVKLKESR